MSILPYRTEATVNLAINQVDGLSEKANSHMITCVLVIQSHIHTCGHCLSVTVYSRPCSRSCADLEDVHRTERQLLHKEAGCVGSNFLLCCGPLPTQPVQYSITCDDSISPSAVLESNGRWLKYHGRKV